MFQKAFLILSASAILCAGVVAPTATNRTCDTSSNFTHDAIHDESPETQTS